MGRLKRISKKCYCRQIVACLWVYCMLCGIPVQVAMGTPTGADVVAGSAGIGQMGNTTTVTMGSARAVINWNSLNTSSSEILQFLKASGGFAVLNRVVQGGMTQFDGSLFGNQGHIIIVNPHGIVFGPTALVQAYKFTASALDISNQNFMTGHYQFVGGDGIGTVSNYGRISAEQVALIGKQVLNAGVISSPGGYVLMAASDRVFLGRQGSDVVVEIDAVKVPDPTDPALTGMGDVINEGTVEAAGGKIVLAAGDTFSRAIDSLDSLAVAVSGGTGRVSQFGTLNADGVEGDGGSITLTAGDVVTLGSDSLTTANAGTNGDGGDVIVYSPDTAIFSQGARIEARGGSESGDGGFVEVSGKENIAIQGSVDTRAPDGETGTFLIDPHNVIIADIAPFDIKASGPLGLGGPLGLLSTTNVVVLTSDTINPEEGWIQVRDPILWDSQHSLELNAEGPTTDDKVGYIKVFDNIINEGTGDLTLKAEGSVEAVYNATWSDSLDLVLSTGGNLTIDAGLNGIIGLECITKSGRNMILNAGDFISLFEDKHILSLDGDITMNAGTTISLGGDVLAGTDGSGSLTVTAGMYTESIGDLIAADNVTINGDLMLFGEPGFGHADQMVAADSGTLTANSWVRKGTAGDLLLFGGGSGDPAVNLLFSSIIDPTAPAASTCYGNLWIVGEGDIQVAQPVTTSGPSLYLYPPCRSGGVAIISNQGEVYTQASGAPLNVAVTGASDHMAQTGVYNIDYIQVYDDQHDIQFRPTTGNYIQFDMTTKTPYFHIEGRVIPRAAVVVMSADTLNIGESAVLTARGNYYDVIPEDIVVDDRPAIDFLDTDNTTIGGHVRDEGEPFDLAIYMASNEENVQIGGEVWIKPCGIPRGPAILAADNFNSIVPAPATVVADAFYNVRFLDNFMEFLDTGDFWPFRMEVCSRVTEWLSQAIANNRLPYAADTGFMEDLLGLEDWPGDDYVLRGAGLGNPGITDGRKWVLEDPPPSPMLAAPLPRWEIPVIEGCPVLLEAASAEVGIARETIQISIERALATRPNIQPCDACARLVDYAAILRDVDGTRMAAMLQVFNEIAPADAPFTPEMASSIATAFAEHLDDTEMPQYATTMEYIDAFVGYIAVMDDELGSPVDDSVAFAIEKYGTPLEESGNANITAYIQMRLAALGG